MAFLPALNDRLAADEAGPGRKCAAIPGCYAVDERSLHLARASTIGTMIGLADIGRILRLAPVDWSGEPDQLASQRFHAICVTSTKICG